MLAVIIVTTIVEVDMYCYFKTQKTTLLSKDSLIASAFPLLNNFAHAKREFLSDIIFQAASL